jgi:hypothetical protein
VITPRGLRTGSLCRSRLQADVGGELPPSSNYVDLLAIPLGLFLLLNEGGSGGYPARCKSVANDL